MFLRENLQELVIGCWEEEGAEHPVPFLTDRSERVNLVMFIGDLAYL